MARKVVGVPIGASYETPMPTEFGPNGCTLGLGFLSDQTGVTCKVEGATSSTVYFDAVLTAGCSVDITDTADTLVNVTLTGTNVAGQLSMTTTAATGQQNPWSGGSSQSNGLNVFDVKSYGAVGNGIADDTAAISNAVVAAERVNGVVYLPPGTYAVSSPIAITKPISVVGSGNIASVIVATTVISEVITYSGVGGATFRDFGVNGNGKSVNGISQTYSPETSIPTTYERVRAFGSTSYQLTNTGAEDVSYIDCICPGNESIPDSTGYAINISVPSGAFRIVGGEYFGVCTFDYQLATVVGSTIGPIMVSNPNTMVNTVLILSGCYVYDGGPSAASCINTSDSLTNVVADGCYFVAQVNRSWINGNIPAGVNITCNSCVYVWGPGTAGSNYIVQASGAGSVFLNSWSTNAGLGTVSEFNAVSGATTVVSTIQGSRMVSGDGMQVTTLSGGGGSDCLAIVDKSTGNAKYLRMDSGSQLEILNSAFSEVIAAIADDGFINNAAGIAPGAFGSIDTSARIYMGSGVPASANGNNGDFYFNSTGVHGTSDILYHKESGAWVALL